MKVTYRDLIERLTETEYHDFTCVINGVVVALRSDCGTLRRYWTLYVGGTVVCTRALFDNAVRLAAKNLSGSSC